jgi:hypothetical protein
MAVKVARRRFVLACVVYAAAMAEITARLWPLVPFPEPLPLAAIGGVSLLFGFAMRRRSLLLPALIFPAGWVVAGIGWFGGIVVLTAAGPVALACVAIGALLRRGWIRLMSRRARRRAERPRRSFGLRLRRRTVAVP